MEKKKTALQKLHDAINHNYENNQGISYASVFNLIDELRATEKAQLEEAFEIGAMEDRPFGDDFGTYYINTYGE